MSSTREFPNLKPAWVREHLDEACLLLRYHRNDFGQAGWPQQLRDGVTAQTRQIETGMGRFARLVFGRDGSGELRRAQFLFVEVPVATVQQHLRRREPPPPLVDELIRIAYHAVIADYRSQNSRARITLRCAAPSVTFRESRIISNNETLCSDSALPPTHP